MRFRAVIDRLDREVQGEYGSGFLYWTKLGARVFSHMPLEQGDEVVVDVRPRQVQSDETGEEYLILRARVLMKL